MRIGVDASSISGDITGIGRYTLELLNRLVMMGHEWFLYSSDDVSSKVPVGGEVSFRVSEKFGRIPNLFNAQSFFPFYAWKDRVDVFWSPTHRLPFFLSKRIASVVTVHDLVWRYAPATMHPVNRRMDSFFMPLAVHAADRVIAVSKSTASDLSVEFPNHVAKIRALQLGSSLPSGEEQLGLLESTGINYPYFLFVGTLEPRKNLSRLIEAFSLLPLRIRNGRKLVVAGGGGWGGIDASNIAKRFCVEDDVVVLGYVSEAQLSALYRNALFLAMPSLYEGFGLPLLEAMANGVPVLTSNCSSMPEVAGQAGILVDPTNLASIANGLAQLLDDEAGRKRLAGLAVSVAGHFSWDSTAMETLAVFEEAFMSRKKRNSQC
ncbi:glycosyltransferase family 4 protein [Pseudomonas protegens]|uniref:glycosyltransferase family 4 protein n=1 Tax=Pseudomonas protegens TaxID=380021 RepID=UPI0034D5157C